MKHQISEFHKIKQQIAFVLLGSLLLHLPTTLNAQTDLPEKVKSMKHHEVPDDSYLPRDESKGTSPAMKFRNINFFTTQVNVNSQGENMLGDAANEPSIAVDPGNPDRMVIGWRQFDNVASNFRQAGYGYTTDGGETWTFPGPINPGVFRSDPVLDADAQGNMYYNSLTKTDGGSYYCDVYKSVDGGSGWDNGTYAAGGDKQWMRVDKTNGPGSGNNYSFWTTYFSSCSPNSFTRSTDYGNSYDECSFVDGEPAWGTLAIGFDSELYLAGRTDEGQIIVAKSTSAAHGDLDVNWDFVSEVDLDGSPYAECDVNPVGLVGQVWVDVDISDGPGSGNIYVLSSVWRYSNEDRGDVMFAKSTDGGLSWSDPQRINTDPTEDEFQWFGTMSVAPNGRIDVVWLDTRGAPAEVKYSALYYSYSVDQGETWSENSILSPIFNSHIGWPNQEKMGDYFDMVSTNKYAHLAWANTLNGEQDVYYGRIEPFYDNIVNHNQSDLFYLKSYPNPFKNKVTIQYELHEKTHVELGIYNLYGQEVMKIANGTQEAGVHTRSIDDFHLPEGTYFCRLLAGNQTETTSLVLIK